MNKKILIISNQCLSQTSSNGRTLLNMLFGYPSHLLAQFYIHGTRDNSLCQKYFNVSDKDALYAFLGKKPKKHPVSGIEKNAVFAKKKLRHSCKNMVLRDIVWMSFRWWTEDFSKFIENFAPDGVLFQAGDSPFMYAIALKISQTRKIPLIMYNSEGYVLKDKIYYSAKRYSPWNILLLRRLRRQYGLLMKYCSHCIYSTEELEKSYHHIYPHKNKSTIYISTDIKPQKNIKKSGPFTLSYCGNLGVGRFDALIEVADTLHTLNKNAKLIICANPPEGYNLDRLFKKPVVDYRGFVSYNEVLSITSSSDMVLHCEKTDRVIDLKYAFSTKIADSLACGIPFLVYASKEYPFVKYLKKYNAAHIAENINELSAVLKKCMTDREYLIKPVENALSLADKNHNIIRNSKAFTEILNSLYAIDDEKI